MTQDKIDTPESEYRQRYKPEWSRRVLQRAGVEAPTAEEMALLIREAGLLRDAVDRFGFAMASTHSDSTALIAAAVVACYSGHAFETDLLHDVQDMIRLELDLSNELRWEELNAESETDT